MLLNKPFQYHALTLLMTSIYRNCLEALRPYHGILLLYEERELLDKLPLDASPTLKKMLSHASPTNSFRTIASDSDLALLHVRILLDVGQGLQT